MVGWWRLRRKRGVKAKTFGGNTFGLLQLGGGLRARRRRTWNDWSGMRGGAVAGGGAMRERDGWGIRLTD
jgi:hypothetical protein